MASLHFLLRPSSNPNPIALPSRSLPVRCANERQALFSRIAPVYDNVRLPPHHHFPSNFGFLFFCIAFCLFNFLLLNYIYSWMIYFYHHFLDLCCGSGDLAFLLSERVESDGKVYFHPFSRCVQFASIYFKNLLMKLKNFKIWNHAFVIIFRCRFFIFINFNIFQYLLINLILLNYYYLIKH